MKYGWNVVNELTFGEISRDFYYANLLVDNIMAENLTEVRSLLEYKKADPNTVMPELGVAPMHILAGLENEDFSTTVMLQAILGCGGDPNVRSEEGLTPVHVAAMWGRCKVLDILLANGGDPELIDYNMFLNAEEYAIKEKQWNAYGVLSTFAVMHDEGLKLDVKDKSNVNFSNKELKNKHLLKIKEKETCYSDTSSIKGSENSSIYSEVRRKKKNNKKHQTDDESCSDRSSWSKNTIQILKQKCSLNAIKSQYSARKSKNVNTKNKTEDESPRVMARKPIDHRECVEDEIQKPTSVKINKVSRNNMNLNVYSDQSDVSGDIIQSLKLHNDALDKIKSQRRKTNIYESIGEITNTKREQAMEHKENRNKLCLYGDAVSESCDWIRKSVNCIQLDKNTLNTIKNQRLGSKIYQSKGLGEDPSKGREKIPPLYDESEVCDWIDPGASEAFDVSSRNKINIHRVKTTTYKSEDPEEQTMISRPKLPRRNRNMCRRKKEGGEMYVCGFSEESIRTSEQCNSRQRRTSSHLSLDVTSSDFDEMGVPNPRMLCKMSRIFLFMLKKRHIYQKIKLET